MKQPPCEVDDFSYDRSRIHQVGANCRSGISTINPRAMPLFVLSFGCLRL
jgi:hypothetical protein